MFYSLGKPFENAHYVSSNFTRRVSYTDGKNLLVVALVRRVEQLHNNSKSYPVALIEYDPKRCYRKGYLISEGSLQEKLTIACCCSNVFCHFSCGMVFIAPQDSSLRRILIRLLGLHCRSNRPLCHKRVKALQDTYRLEDIKFEL